MAARSLANCSSRRPMQYLLIGKCVECDSPRAGGTRPPPLRAGVTMHQMCANGGSHIPPSQWLRKLHIHFLPFKITDAREEVVG